MFVNLKEYDFKKILEIKLLFSYANWSDKNRQLYHNQTQTCDIFSPLYKEVTVPAAVWNCSHKVAGSPVTRSKEERQKLSISPQTADQRCVSQQSFHKHAL